MKSTLKTMHRWTATCGARVVRSAQPSMRRFPKPSSLEKKRHVVIQSILPAAVVRLRAGGQAALTQTVDPRPGSRSPPL